MSDARLNMPLKPYTETEAAQAHCESLSREESIKTILPSGTGAMGRQRLSFQPFRWPVAK